MTYKIPARCINCDADVQLEIPRGIRVVVFTPGFKCETCGCVGTMQKVDKHGQET